MLKEIPKRKKAVLKRVALVIFCLIIGLSVPVMVQQSRFLAIGIFNREIERIELVEYKDKPFESEVASILVLEGNNPLTENFAQEVNFQEVCFFHPKTSKRVLFFHCADGVVVSAFVGDRKIGLDYGSVWVRVKNLEVFLAAFVPKEGE